MHQLTPKREQLFQFYIASIYYFVAATNVSLYKALMLNAEQNQQQNTRTEQGVPGPLKTQGPRPAPLSAPALPSVYGYSNYRSYLADWFAAKKKTLSGFSGQLFAQKAGIASGTLLGMVIRAKRNLSAHTTRCFIRGLGLTGSEARYFETLVLYNQSTQLDDQAHYLSQLANYSPNGGIKTQLKNLSDWTEFLGQWHHPVIKELVALPDFQATGEWIAAKLGGAVTVRSAEASLECLKRLNLLTQTSDGKWIAQDAKVMIDPIHPNSGIQRFHRSYLEQAARYSLTKPRDEREFGFLTVALNETDFLSVKEQVKEFWKSIMEKYPMTQSTTDRVVIVSVQAIQVTECTSSLSQAPLAVKASPSLRRSETELTQQPPHKNLSEENGEAK